MTPAEIIGNDYIQLAVIISGLLTLGLLIFQGGKLIVLPLISVARNGVARSREKSKENFEKRVQRSQDLSVYISELAIEAVKISNALITVILSTAMSILSTFLYVPGYRDQAVIVIDMSPGGVTAVAAGAQFISFALMIFTTSSTLKFASAVRRTKTRSGSTS